MATEVLAIVPVRLDSTRFAGKALFPVEGRPLVLHLLDSLKKSRRIDRILVATDNSDIRRAIEAAGYQVVLTRRKHRTGSDRIAEAAAETHAGIVVNVQGDNFGLDGRVLDRVIEAMKADKSIAYATLARRIGDQAELSDTDTVKVVISADGHALWFSRLPVPYQKSLLSDGVAGKMNYYAHIGVYFFRSRALQQFASWRRSVAEQAESLEQLRILEHGGRIRVFITKARPISIDSPDDLRKIEALYTQG
jgi:3-deoxy-manno-octulosonate cytidylyltransferase (CMP-KDO synthetase)